MLQSSLCIALGLISILVFVVALTKSRRGQFYSDTPALFPLGIFVWGDALALAPFWLVAAIIFWWLEPVMIARLLCVFFAIRAAYEVVYWINHQVAHRDYCPPMFRQVKWLGANEAAILYQLMNMLQVIVALGLMIMTYN
ncbi:MAG TPA: hypothetical protein VD999_05080 [Vitreimonas sp.]|nr:hypothetical protein [Vitreimonas sp.]